MWLFEQVMARFVQTLCSAVVVELRSYFLFLSPNLVFAMRYTVYVSEKQLIFCFIQL